MTNIIRKHFIFTEIEEHALNELCKLYKLKPNSMIYGLIMKQFELTNMHRGRISK